MDKPCSSTSKENSKPNDSAKLSLEERQAKLARLANPDGPRNIQKRVREKTLMAICIDGHKPMTKEKAFVIS